VTGNLLTASESPPVYLHLERLQALFECFA
jgi:hypothetical protein